MAAVLGCGPRAVLSHHSAASLWEIRDPVEGAIHVSVPPGGGTGGPGVRVHRTRTLGADDVTTRHGIPATAPVRTLLDLATLLRAGALEAAVNAADRLELVSPEALREALEDRRGQSGVASLRTLLDRRTFRLTDSELERRFLPIAQRAGLPVPKTQARVNGFRVDFHWPDLGLVVETDGLRYHRTPAQQAKDRVRDQIHTAAGLTQVRFSHAQVRYEAETVRRTLAAVATRLRRSPTG
jgi:very-short-patch-repair endonuclease